MSNKTFGNEINHLIKSPFDRHFYLKNQLPKMELIHVYSKYDEQFKRANHQDLRNNLEILLYLQGLKAEEVSIVTGISTERIDYLTNKSQNNARNKNECNLDIEDYVFLAIWLTAHTGHLFDRIFDKNFKAELKLNGLMART